jgi:hypothetical protein
MNAAFEDCVVLDELIEQHGTAADGYDWPAIFAAFEAARVPNTRAIATMALENYLEMRDTVRDAKFQLRADVSFELERRFPGKFVPRYSMVMFHPRFRTRMRSGAARPRRAFCASLRRRPRRSPRSTSAPPRNSWPRYSRRTAASRESRPRPSCSCPRQGAD